MFALIAAIVFATAIILAVVTMVVMFTTYHDKMMEALLYSPAPKVAPVYHVAVRRSRLTASTLIKPRSDQRTARMPIALAA